MADAYHNNTHMTVHSSLFPEAGGSSFFYKPASLLIEPENNKVIQYRTYVAIANIGTRNMPTTA